MSVTTPQPELTYSSKEAIATLERVSAMARDFRSAIKRAPPRKRPRRIAKRIAARGGRKSFVRKRYCIRIRAAADYYADQKAWAS